MRLQNHLNLFIQAVIAWTAFWIVGLPHYYQQYSTAAVAVGSVLLSVAISLLAVFILARVRPSNRASRAFWISFYFTVPFAVLDIWYCAIYLGHGLSYLSKYWYLSVFYLTPWLTFPPTAKLLNNVRQDSAKEAARD
jgi:uncharacterized membrane protein